MTKLAAPATLLAASAAALLSCAETQSLGPTVNEPLPEAVGRCAQTTITQTGSRLEGTSPYDSGSNVNFSNGGYQVTYGSVDGIIHSQVGDPVRMCLVEIPQGCPPGDDRGRVYTTTNLRTGESWRLANASHGCGGP